MSNDFINRTVKEISSQTLIGIADELIKQRGGYIDILIKELTKDCKKKRQR